MLVCRVVSLYADTANYSKPIAAEQECRSQLIVGDLMLDLLYGGEKHRAVGGGDVDDLEVARNRTNVVVRLVHCKKPGFAQRLGLARVHQSRNHTHRGMSRFVHVQYGYALAIAKADQLSAPVKRANEVERAGDGKGSHRNSLDMCRVRHIEDG